MGNNRKQRYRQQVYRESRAAAGITKKSFEQFVEAGKGRLANELWNYAEYSPTGEITINKERTRQAASDFVKDTQDASYPREYIISSYQSISGRKVSRQYAEGRINAEQAIRARAILIAADQGSVKLTPAQRERLERVERGEYLDLVYGQYKSGKRGTLQGVSKKEKYGSSGNEAATPEGREEKAAQFRAEIARYGGWKRKKEERVPGFVPQAA